MITFLNLNQEKGDTWKFDKPGEYVVFFHNRSGKFTFDLAHKGVNVDIYGIFTGKNAEDYKVETVQHHTAGGAISNLLIKGVFEDMSRFDYSGLIRIEKKGQHSHAYQKNQNLILAPGVFVQSKPYLEILANDVFCTHGSTTGKLSQEQVFYLESRGLNPEEARQLIVQGFVGEVVDKIKEKVPSFKLQL